MPCFDEMTLPDGSIRDVYQRVARWLSDSPAELLESRRSQAEILAAGKIPADLVYRNAYFRPEMSGRRVPHDIYVHIAGIDIVRVDDNKFYVLEDNARTPSGVSYMLENREV